VAGVAPASRDERVAEVVAVLGIDDVLDRMPHQLSGGQQQRVAMARALIRAPRLLLMDEPLSNLDSVLRAGLRAEIARMARELRITTLYVTHDQVEAQTMADRVAVLRSGRLEDVGRPADLYRSPATLHVAAFLGSPRMSLIRAYVHVVCDSHVGLHVGDQVIYLPWSDMRCRVLAHYNGEDVAMGMRADALVPVTSGTTGEVLHGRITHVAHHGHESVASLDVGARTVEVDESSPARVVMPSRASAPSRVRQLLGETLRIGHRAQADPSATAGHGDGRHTLQRNDVTVGVLPYAEVSLGALLSVQLRLDELHFFDLDNGQRIDVRRR
jgi:multiple sugar transport system ATP-binding protein